MMKLHELKPSSRRYKAKRVGRGNSSGKGTTAGRGTKGQRARSGGRNKHARRGLKRLIERTPKIRGFTSRRPVMQVVTLQSIEKVLPEGATVTSRSLKQAGLVRKVGVGVKILGAAKLHKKYTVQVDRISKQAATAVEQAGGSVTQPKPKETKAS